MNIFEFRKNKLGMTLVEMVISLVILSILMTSTMGMVISSNNIFISTSKAALDRYVGNSVFNLIENIVRYSTHMSIKGSADSGNTSKQSLYINVTDTATNSGIIKYKHDSTNSNEYVDLYASGFYGGRTVQYYIKSVPESKNHIEVTVKVFRDGKTVYSNSSVLKCVNLDLIKSGVDANPISDDSSANSANQYLYFTCDEQLIAGGGEAWSIEQKINSFMQDYNAILAEYFSYLTYVEGYYENEVITNHSETIGGRISKSVYEAATTNRQTAIFGTSNTYTEPTPVPDGADAAAIAEKVKTWNNLRGYFQQKIYDLLGFTPTGASAVSTKTNRLTQKLSIEKKINNVNRKVEVQNPYFGVVATKEELYMGFLLKYYDDNGDKKITKSEYPAFEDPNSFFKDTMFTNYVSKNNPMIIMGYFNDLLNENYASLFSLPSDDSSFYEIKVTDKGVGLAVDGNKYKTTTINATTDDYISFSEISSNSVSGYDFYFYKWNGTTSRSDVKIKHINSIDYAKSEWLTYCKVNGTVYSYDYGDTNTGVYAYFDNDHDGSDGIKSKFELTAKRADADFRTRTGISYTNIEKYASITPASGNSSLTNSSTMTITANNNLPEGWYRFFYKSNNSITGGKTVYTYIYFYLRADATLEDGKPNTLPNGSITDTSSEGKKYAVLAGDSITLTFSKNMISSLKYNQAQYVDDENAVTTSAYVNKYTINQHEYKDWVLYSADWNSWFAPADNGGILNNLFSTGYVAVKTAVNVVNGWITGEPTTTTITRRIDQLDCSTDYPTDPALCLGITGQTTIDKIDGNLRSYEAAYIVYHPGRGCWYYLPANSTKLSQAISGSGLSHNDYPTPIDITAYQNSSYLQDDINKRQVSSSGLWGLVDTTYDALWVPLPVEKTVVTTN